MHKEKEIAVIGTGPAGLMAAHVLASAGCKVRIFEKRPSAGRKILIAGSSGLNISFDCPLDSFVQNYSGPQEQWQDTLRRFTPQDWLKFVEGLGLETFKGTSGRYFVREMKGSGLLKAWMESLKKLGVEFVFGQECTGFEQSSEGIRLGLGQSAQEFSAVCFCLGGGSWEKNEKPLRWPEIFISKGLSFTEFRSANCGFKVDWTAGFLKEAEGLPLKGIVFESKKGSRVGELMITQYGLEGTPIYALGEVGETWIDLKPGLSEADILKKLRLKQENLAPLRRVKKQLSLSPAALALLYHHSPPEALRDLEKLVKRLKRFPVVLRERQPLEEAISCSGGLAWKELDDRYMLRRYRGVFAAGEMLDWVAPTGGFLIQGCVSQGYSAASGILDFVRYKRTTP